MTTITAKLKRFWFWLFTGYPSLVAKRRAIEHEAHRFNGVVHWRDK